MSTDILVTGAGGFIGRHLMQELSQAGHRTVAATRDGRNGTRRADVSDPASLQAALAGVDAVVHCAVGNHGVTVEGTRNVLRAAAAAGVRRVVHFSSISVYAPRDGVVAEDAPTVPGGTRGYAAWKAAAEDACAAERGVDVVRLRPSIVYGPGGQQWVSSYARRILSRRWGTFGPAGEGTCNLVHVADVAAAVSAALHAPGVSGQAFNVNGPEAVTWNEWFTRIAQAVGVARLRPLSMPLVRARSLTVLPHKVLRRLGIRLADAWMLGTASPGDLALYAARVSYPTDLAARHLGWTPRIGVDEGLAGCLPGLRQEGLVRAA